MSKISEYPEATALDDDDELVVVEDGVTKKVTVVALGDALNVQGTVDASDENLILHMRSFG